MLHESKMENQAPKKHVGGYRQINKALNICAFEDYLEAQLSHLPAIADIEQISPRVVRVLGQNAGKVSIVSVFLIHDQVANRIASLHFKEPTPTSSEQAPTDSSSTPAKAFQNGPT